MRYLHRPYSRSRGESPPLVACVQVRGWHMYCGLDSGAHRQSDVDSTTTHYILPTFVSNLHDRTNWCCSNYHKTMHARIYQLPWVHDVSTRALILINFRLVWKWKIKRNRTWSLRRVWFRMQAWSMIDLQIRRPNCLPVSYRGSAFWFSHWAHGSMRWKGLLHE